MNATAYANYILEQCKLNLRFEYWRAYEAALIHGDRDDPNSFDINGLPSTNPGHYDLGYYPLYGLQDEETLYIPCWDRVQAIIAEGDTNGVPEGPLLLEGRKLTEHMVDWDGGYTALTIPIMRTPISGFNLNQAVSVVIPYDDSKEIHIQATRLDDLTMEVFFTSDDSLD